ncbi:MAG TPA: phosphopantetheine-binding protein, partial [Thermoanaerobaculia bacterium]|nr:phosphopantetheine-binding protein [Thermoanaerobaculia bacterium]
YLVPSRIHLLKELPLDAAGEVDGHALLAGAEPIPEPAPGPPRNALERDLAALWAQLLGTAPENLDDDFFAHGGDSFSAVLLLQRVAERSGGHSGLAGLSSFFEEPTLRHLAEILTTPARSEG